MVTHEKIKKVLHHWQLENEKLTDVTYDETGKICNSVCHVGDDYIIKFSSNLAHIKNHIAVLLAIENVGLSISVPLKTKTGEYIVENDELYFYVTKRLTGKTMKRCNTHLEDYIPKSRLIGNVIGQLSIALSNIDVITKQSNIFKRATEWAVPTLVKNMNLPTDFLETYEKEFGQIFELLPQQIIHRDLNPSNIIICDDIWGVFDFDLSEINLRIFDPCYAASAILSENFETDNTYKLQQWILIYKNIMYGYDEIVKLSDVEWKAIPYVILTNQLIATAWFSEQEKYKELYQTNKKMTDWLLQNFTDMKFE